MGSVSDLFRVFEQEWSKRWSKHDAVDIERRRPAVESANVPQRLPEADFPDITPDLWRAEVRKKKANTAAGLDGITKQDLLLLPEDLLQLLLDVYLYAESSGVWPIQCMQAVISALEKRPCASRVEHYRPITVLSLVCRIWSGIRSRQCLRHLAQFCHPCQHGCLPCKSAANIWYDTQATIELARRAHTTKSGIVTDVIKAFNCIPRQPIYALALQLGIPKKVVIGWQGALHQLERRFKIRGSLSPGVLSSTGFPEGCGLSCTAVAILGISFHRFLSLQVPAVATSSYVDNLAGVGESFEQIVDAHDAFQQWAGIWDLELDKTVTWSTKASTRKAIRDAGFQVVLDGPDLGGNTQYSLRHTNYGLTRRISDFELSWLRLAQSAAPYSHKVSAVRMAGWPSTLHASSIVHIGPRHFDALRSQAAKGLNCAGPGMNPKLLLGFVYRDAPG